MKIFGALLLSVFALATGCGKSETAFRFKDFKITERPGELPGGLPASFRYQGAEPILSVAFEERPDAITSSPEGAVEFKSSDPNEKISAYYEKVLKENGWKIIQSKHDPLEVLLMAESTYSEIVTVILRGSKPTKIRLYIRRLSREASRTVTPIRVS